MRTSADATVLGVASLSRTLPVVGAALVLLFVAVRPEASAGLGLLARIGFWTLHIAIGIGGLALASLVIRQRLFARGPLPVAILVTGIVGSLAAAPVYWLVDQWLAVPASEVPDDWLDRFALAGPWQAVAAEWLEVTPPFVASWFAVNLPLLFGKPSLDDGPPEPGEPPEPPPSASAPAPHGEESAALRAFFDRLPTAIGADVVAVSSDLHYLHVHTTGGKAMVHGSLKDVAAALGDRGMLVHRSHWVAHVHVQHVQIAGKDAWCELSTGLRVPVSRRKRVEVKTQYGVGQVSTYFVDRNQQQAS